MALFALGINHHSAPLSMREQVAFHAETLLDALGDLVRAKPVKEAAILSTCNRTELYCAAENPEVAVDWLSEYHRVPRQAIQPYLYTLPQEDAVRHAFRVASGLDSMVLGEAQILGQMKNAVRLAEEAGTMGMLLNKLFQRSFAVAKEVRTTTAIGANIVSMAAAGVHLAQRIFESLDKQKILFVGAGEMIELCATHFAAQNPQQITIANRTLEKGEDLASRFASEKTRTSAIRLDELGEHLPLYDIVVSCTGSPMPLIGLGLMERAVKTLCEPLAKRLPSCTHADMDQDAAHKVFKVTRADLKKHGKSKLLPTWETFKAALLARVEAYNAAPHRALPRIEDQATGRRRHLSPNEYWGQFVARGFEPFTVPPAIRDELFMPGIPRKVRNGEVALANNVYFAEELADFHGEWVDVRYDIWDPSQVRCWTLAGELICTARLDGNKLSYFPKSQVEAARERRERKQVGLLTGKIRQLVPGAMVTLPEEPQTLMADSFTPPEPALEVAPVPEPVVDTAPQPAKRPLFGCTQDRYAWLMRNPERVTEADRDWLAAYVAGDQYADLQPYFEARGIAWPGEPRQAKR